VSAANQQILIVDSDRLARLIAMMFKDEPTEVAFDGTTALDKIGDSPPDIIIADVDVPGSGIRLAEIVGISPEYQKIPVILTSVNPTTDTIIKARNAGASSYLAKPFRPSEIRSRIENIRAAPPAENEKPATDEIANPFADDDEDEFVTRVRSIEGLPAFPTTHAELIKLARSEDATSEDIAEKLQFDPGLLSTLFKLANSPYYGFNKKVHSVQLAVTLLGLEEVANLVTTAQIFDNFGSKGETGGLDVDGFWRHTVGTAIASRALAKKLQVEVESAFLGGILHDIGKIVLDRHFSDYYTGVIKDVKKTDSLIVDSEKKRLGLTHAEIGGQLATEWNFAKNYLNVIHHHHTPAHAKRYQRLVCLVHVADAIVRRLGYGSGGDSHQPAIDDTAMDRFGIEDKGLQRLIDAVQADLDDGESILSALGS
jgi:putative nucleotidyltransferase with HDIG domain